jgi:ADP-ribose pyrophosphatase YjhB (NUDIX family)
VTFADRVTHGGGVVYRRKSSEVEVLLVRSRRPPHDWVLPKGHIESGETPDMCARREVAEEAGVDAEPGEFLGVDRFLSPRGEVVAAFYLLRYLAEVPPLEERERVWLPIAVAESTIAFNGARGLLRRAREVLDGE